jgi:hypothetical protein
MFVRQFKGIIHIYDIWEKGAVKNICTREAGSDVGYSKLHSKALQEIILRRSKEREWVNGYTILVADLTRTGQ